MKAKPPIRIVVSLPILFVSLPILFLSLGGPARAEDPMRKSPPPAQGMLQDFVEHYRAFAPESLSFVVEIKLREPSETWRVVVSPGARVELLQGTEGDQPAFVFSMAGETLRRIHAGEIAALTAGGKALASDVAPLEVEFGEGAKALSAPQQAMLEFLQRFFNRESPERILLGTEHSRIVHGAHAIPLYYAPGFRSAWYRIVKGQRLNEEGDRNPFPQAFIIISGAGSARIGDRTVAIHAGESFYVPPASDHVVWTDNQDGLVLLWLAWGEGA